MDIYVGWKYLKSMGLMEAQTLRQRTQAEESPGSNSGGDCYEAAGQYMMQKCSFGNDDCNLILVHGEVAGQGSLEGITYGHAWVLDGSTVVDKSNGRNIQMPQMIYYAIGQISNISNVHQYPWLEARKKIMEYQHWGPWDLETESGL